MKILKMQESNVIKNKTFSPCNWNWDLECLSAKEFLKLNFFGLVFVCEKNDFKFGFSKSDGKLIQFGTTT